MNSTPAGVFPIASGTDVARVRQAVAACLRKLGFAELAQTQFVTAASELARNVVIYGSGGTCRLEVLEELARVGLRLIFEDFGPGIPDVGRALEDGYTTGGGMGLGLGGAKRLSDQFEIVSKLGAGTRISIVKWRGPPRAKR